jgi:hypothetical protein
MKWLQQRHARARTHRLSLSLPLSLSLSPRRTHTPVWHLGKCAVSFRVKKNLKNVLLFIHLCPDNNFVFQNKTKCAVS